MNNTIMMTYCPLIRQCAMMGYSIGQVGNRLETPPFVRRKPTNHSIADAICLENR
jgi:hypothetical protein